jgi:tetratricopeptide (TPR) repeat protein
MAVSEDLSAASPKARAKQARASHFLVSRFPLPASPAATRCLLAAMLAVPLLAQPLRDRAAGLYRERRFAEAAVLLEQQLEADPKDFASLLMLGLSRQLNGERPEAEQVFRRAVAQHPSHAAARFYLARVEYLRGRLADAERDAMEARKRGHPPAPVRHLVGLIRVEQNRAADALAAYQEALAADPRFAPAAISAGELLIALRRERDALPMLDRALMLQPESGEARYHRARALLALGDTARAEAGLAAAPDHEAAARLLRQLRAGGVRPGSGAASARRPTPVRFLEIAKQAGVDFTLHNNPTAQKHLIETMPGGLAVFDYDGDGRPDLFFANGATLPDFAKTGARYRNRLYRNLGGMRFQDVTLATGLDGRGYSMGAAAADYDNDGDADLFVPGLRASVLYENRGGKFVDVTAAAGIAGGPWPVAGVWFDYDRDGRLDLFIVNYLHWTPAYDKYCGDPAAGLRVYCDPRGIAGSQNQLYRNLGNGRFEDVTLASGIGAHTGKGMSASALDYDGDGRQDLFVTNDTAPNFLFRNLGNGRFAEVGLEAGVALKDDGKPVSSMGVSVADYDADGLPDLAVTALSGEWFPIFRNQGKGYFRDATASSGMAAASSQLSGWGIVFGDLNNDGIPDLFTANAHVTDNIDRFSHYRYRQPNGLFLGRGDGTFVDAAAGAGPQFQQPRPHRGAALADLDGDGDPDAVVTVLGGPAELWRNDSPSSSWIAIRLRGTRSNRDAIGARVCVDSQCQWMESARGYASSTLAPLHFGLGQRARVARLTIRWPSGAAQELLDVAPRQVLEVVEPR